MRDEEILSIAMKVDSEFARRTYFGDLLKFGAAIAEATREACAKSCDDEAKAIRREGEGSTNAQYDWMADGAERCAETLRTRRSGWLGWPPAPHFRR